VNLNPYLNFRDNAKEALSFYQSVFGGEVTTSTFGEYEMGQDASENGKIMHGQLTAPDGLVLMAADVPEAMPFTPGTNYSVSLSGGPEDDGTLRGYWEKLTDGGQVTVPLEVAPWGDAFGMCTDRFGIPWMVNIAGTGQPQ
jgi:PhnB protein